MGSSPSPFITTKSKSSRLALSVSAVTKTRLLTFVFAGAALAATIFSAYSFSYFESLPSYVLVRHRPEFVQSVTDSLLVASVLWVIFGILYLVPRGSGSAYRLGAVGFFALLNVYYLWTSRAIFDVLTPVMSPLYLDPFESYGFGFGFDGNVLADGICAGFLAAFTACAFLFYRKGHPPIAAARTLQFGSLAVLPLCLDILVFDRGEFTLHVTAFQKIYGLLPWFSNEDLMFSAMVVFAAASLLSALPRRKRGRP